MINWIRFWHTFWLWQFEVRSADLERQREKGKKVDFPKSDTHIAFTFFMSSIAEINQKVKELHLAHYDHSVDGLVMPDQSPNCNLIYHLYNDGTITFQKGGWAYLRRGEFTLEPPLFDQGIFDFPEQVDGKSYAVLTESECKEMRTFFSRALDARRAGI